ncbi:hypothetical protein FJZ31_40850 [Candidatus Poribacteria bacterium]|nr:hypothetical protein [Candidatus Poribacteria bacterium]
MKTITIASTLFLIVLFAGCGEPISEESQNIDAILSPDDTQIAFARWFHYYVNKASVFEPGGWRDTKYHATFIYTIDRSTKKLTKLVEVDIEGQYYCDRYYCPVSISWEDDFIAYSNWNTIYIINPDGSDKQTVVAFTEMYGSPMLFTLSADAQRLFYIEYKWERAGLYSVNLDGTGKSFVTTLGSLVYNIQDMVLDASKKHILLIERTYDSKEPVVWQLNPDGTDLRKSEDGLAEYRRRRLGGWESKPPLAELEKLTRDISYAEWGVPAPDEF